MNDVPAQAGYYRKIATVLVRIVAIGYGIQGLCLALNWLAWAPLAEGPWISPVLYLVAAAALWAFSPRIGQVVARALDA